jgi:magnesium-protoporphyrin O-methyltransferase
MRATILSWLPEDLSGRTLLDAGCGTGALSTEAARRGARVTAIDVAPTLVQLAEERLPHEIGEGTIDFRVGDMLDPALGTFDHVVAMDSLIHYEPADVVGALSQLAERTRGSIVFTFAPATPMLSTMHAVGKLFPRSDRAPAIVPVAARRLARAITEAPALSDWALGRTLRVKSGFYTSEALEIVRR